MTQSRNILFLSSNGIGLGHLTRQMAIATRLPHAFQPFFHSQALSCETVLNAGIPITHFAHHTRAPIPVSEWHAALSRDIVALANRIAPAAIVVDSTAIFTGYLDAFSKLSDIPKIWVRRAMWSPENAHFLAHAHIFDAILEPGELATELDEGPTSTYRDTVITLDPVLFSTPGQRQPREVARKHLGLADDERAIALVLGATMGGPRLGKLRKMIATRLPKEMRVIEFVSPMSTDKLEPAPWEQRRLYPWYPISTAFDAAIAFAGYNSFHELLLGSVPTLFFANSDVGMDRQDLRAQWAAQNNLALTIENNWNAASLSDALDQLATPEVAANLRRNCARLPKRFGATRAAEIIADIAK